MTEHEMQALRQFTEAQRHMEAGLKTFNRKMIRDFPRFAAAFRDLAAALDRSYRV